MKRDGNFKCPVSSLKPALTDLNKLQRAEYCISLLELDNKQYQDLMDTIFIDEKCFFLTEDGKSYILADGEEEPVRKV